MYNNSGCLTGHVRTLCPCPCLVSGAGGERASEEAAGAPVTVRAPGGWHHLVDLKHFWREAGRCVFEVAGEHGQQGSCLKKNNIIQVYDRSVSNMYL